MDISLAEEHAYYFIPQISLEVARDRIEKKKTSLVAGMFGTLISRPNPADILLLPIGIAFQNAFELGMSASASSTQYTPTFVSGALLGAFISSLLFFPLITFWRLLLHQWQLWRSTPIGYPRRRPSVLIHLLAGLWAILTYLFLHSIDLFSLL